MQLKLTHPLKSAGPPAPWRRAGALGGCWGGGRKEAERVPGRPQTQKGQRAFTRAFPGSPSCQKAKRNNTHSPASAQDPPVPPPPGKDVSPKG